MQENKTDYPFISINELKPYENNARLHPQEQIDKIVNSINEFGFITPVIIDENNTILVGHGRTQAAKQAGLEKVPYRRITDLTSEQKRAYILADNKLSNIAEWDDELLKMELDNISIDMTAFGFDEFNINIDEDTEAVVEDEIVLDLFGGSGSTLIACEQLNRACYTMELEPKYVDVIIKRWETLTGEKAELIKGV